MASIGINITPSQEAVNAAPGLLDVEMLKEWCNSWGVFPDRDDANEAARNDDLLVQQWIESKREMK